MLLSALPSAEPRVVRIGTTEISIVVTRGEKGDGEFCKPEPVSITITAISPLIRLQIRFEFANFDVIKLAVNDEKYSIHRAVS